MRTLRFIGSLLILLPSLLFGQEKSFKTSLYFDVDRSQLRADALPSLNNLLDSLSGRDIKSIVISGNTDNTASDLYNEKLSEHRATTVKEYLLSKGINASTVSTAFYGEAQPSGDNRTKEGRQLNRRVDIIVTYRITVKQGPLCGGNKEVKDSCNLDTTLILPGGTQVVFNRCEYLELQHCLEFKETKSASDVIANGFSLMDSARIPISSCGMLKISVNPGCSNRTCFNTPVIVRFPVPPEKDCDFCRTKAKIYLVQPGGSWSSQKDTTQIRLVKIGTQEFYEFRIKCPNSWTNCDCGMQASKIKFKTSRKYRIVSVTIRYDCPTAVIAAFEKRRNLFMAYLPCRGNTKMITAVVKDRKGIIYELPLQPLNDLPKKVLFAKCEKNKTVVKKVLGFIPVKSHGLYRKYFIPGKLLVQRNKQ